MKHDQKVNLIKISAILTIIFSFFCLIAAIYLLSANQEIAEIISQMLEENIDPELTEYFQYLINNFDLIVLYSKIYLISTSIIGLIASIYLLKRVTLTEYEFYENMLWYYIFSVTLIIIGGLIVAVLMLIAITTPKPSRLIHNSSDMEKEITNLKQKLAEGKITQSEYDKKIIEIIK